MVNATVDNEAISIQLIGESATVPSGEIWKINMISDNNANVGINGTDVFGNNHGDIGDSEFVLVGGDTIECKSDNYGIHISGFVVNK